MLFPLGETAQPPPKLLPVPLIELPLGDVSQPPPKLLPVPYQVVAEAEPIVEPETNANDAIANNTFFMSFSILICCALLHGEMKTDQKSKLLISANKKIKNHSTERQHRHYLPQRPLPPHRISNK